MPHSEKYGKYLSCALQNFYSATHSGGILFAVASVRQQRNGGKTMAFIDYYKILGVDKDIPQSKVKAAYHKRSKQFHPDLHPDDPKAKAKFQALTEAYEVISDPEKRKKYDQYGEHWREADMYGAAGGQGGNYFYQGAGGSPFEGFDFSSFGTGCFSSFFQDLFGKRTQQHNNTFKKKQNAAEQQCTVNIDLYKAMLGGEVVVQLPSGSKVRLKVKPETQSGTKVRLRGKGAPTGNGTPGDLIINYQVQLPTDLNERQRELLRQMRDAR